MERKLETSKDGLGGTWGLMEAERDPGFTILRIWPCLANTPPPVQER